ncbi:EexN family lipoprotein [Ralstonia pseudosolanacearum]|uniref:EexN family lipoprotein n=1 Tax=Ralstonia pseudosolanacearum TaxID=1310165 RepID=UPI002676F115|nr:EexN family lipoprotein [Ralstonia pseudosolanacearum]MDO3507257.1 EexN family lipoprotein [Ralstonia pseudosolanacearum]MDO3513549.1 EexN family lipoprotein [Ralstonia pseudosolanacearum]MDO3537873.1 EexN family lipoprotein [Ralstonia pseudosolanacearum]MDO3605021.1 EexN family lipoprotein [Ralstonia pseudosolanacearum]MDO3609950.1 EexN family lipoprotein [Ralstonia pseudosolanacearum]
MKKNIPLLLAAMLVACGKSEPTATHRSSVPTETVESLVANPERLKELRLQCKTDRAKLGDELCNRVAEATNRRFLGDGKTPYTPPKEQPKF